MDPLPASLFFDEACFKSESEIQCHPEDIPVSENFFFLADLALEPPSINVEKHLLAITHIFNPR